MGGTAQGNVVAGASSRDRLVGQPVLRTEDARFVTGAGCFVDDFTREGLCHAVVVRSAVAHARLTGISPGERTRAARRPRGTDRLRPGRPRRSDPDPPRAAPRLRPVPAGAARRDRVRYVGEPVAVVIAEDRGGRRRCGRARHAGVRASRPGGRRPPGHDRRERAPRERRHERRIALHGRRAASPDAAFATAEYTRTETFRCHRHGAMPLETRGLVAEWDAVAAQADRVGRDEGDVLQPARARARCSASPKRTSSSWSSTSAAASACAASSIPRTS